MRLPSARASEALAPRRAHSKAPAFALDRRQALLRALVGLTVGRLTLQTAQPALAYTVISSGSISDAKVKLVDVSKRFEKTPDDPYVYGEKAQLE